MIENLAHNIDFLLKIYCLTFAGGAGLMLGLCCVGKLLKWAPVNVTVNVIDQRPEI